MPSPSTFLRSMLGIDDNLNRADASTPTLAQSHLTPPAKSTRNLKSSAQTTAIRRTRSSSWGDVRITDTFTQATGAAELDELDDSVCEALYINAALRSRGLSYVCASASASASADGADEATATTSEEVLAGSLQASIHAPPSRSTRIGTLHRPVHVTASPSRRPSIAISDKAPPAVPSEPLGQNPAALRKTASASSLRRPKPRPLPAIPQAVPRPALPSYRGPSVRGSSPDEAMDMT
ncbi:hypothetical protein HMN09_00789000 [Mycena chlorophos]|uniref:Uncharacterized protein n=1 Tax=Mycena chlorophos TaxID=658473 RepID=A0A8H6ST78_MYCCL|nr:hypothetical protein HMN09_00789000 [Mycena chlorophos]